MPVENYLKELTAIQTRLFHTTRVLPGVEVGANSAFPSKGIIYALLSIIQRLIRHLHSHDIPIAVATSSTRTKLVLKTGAHTDLFALFDSITCGDDDGIVHGKPEPDLFLAARSKLGNPPAENCLVFEDATNGIQAAGRAGMSAIWIPGALHFVDHAQMLTSIFYIPRPQSSFSSQRRGLR